MPKRKIAIVCGAALLIAVAVGVAVVLRNRRQPAPPPDVPVSPCLAEVRVKAVERKAEPFDHEVVVASSAVAIVCGADSATADRYEARNDALRSIARRRDLPEKDVAALIAYLRTADSAMRVERVAAHYEYVPFGALITSTYNTTSTDYDFRANNPFRFSSEYSDCVLGLVYYNFRHYIQGTGCWLMRDLVAGKGFERVFNDIFPCPQNKSACGEYSFVNNCSISEVDRLGLVCICCFKGRTGKLRVDDSCKGKLRIWIIDEDNGKPSAAVAGQEVSADGFAVNGTMYKVDGSTCVTLKCSTTTISVETCVNNLAYIVGKKEPREVPWDTFGGGKTPSKEDVAPLVK